MAMINQRPHCCSGCCRAKPVCMVSRNKAGSAEQTECQVSSEPSSREKPSESQVLPRHPPMYTVTTPNSTASVPSR